MKCWYCESEVIWQNDFTFEDYGYEEEEGIITVMTCSNDGCKAEYEIKKEV